MFKVCTQFQVPADSKENKLEVKTLLSVIFLCDNHSQSYLAFYQSVKFTLNTHHLSIRPKAKQ